MEIKTTIDIFKKDLDYDVNTKERNNFHNKKWVAVDDVIKLINRMMEGRKQSNRKGISKNRQLADFRHIKDKLTSNKPNDKVTKKSTEKR